MTASQGADGRGPSEEADWFNRMNDDVAEIMARQ